MKNAKIGLLAIVTAVTALAIVMSGLLVITGNVNFAGLDWNIMKYSGNFNAVKEGEFLILSVTDGRGEIQTDITNIDEVLVIYDGFASAHCDGQEGNAGAGISASVVSSLDAEQAVGDSVSVGTDDCQSRGDSAERYFEPSIWKFRNNFDGTWSVLQGLGIGDVFIVKRTSSISGRALLTLGAATSATPHKGGSAVLKVYNIVIKENAFAVCKADEFWQDKNQDAIPTSDECLDLQTIVLNSEEAIKESFDEKLARVTAELEAKNTGLSSDIAALEQQLASQTGFNDAALRQQIEQLQAELKLTNQRLADVQARDPTVINTIISQELIKEPSFIDKLINRIIAFFKGLFS